MRALAIVHQADAGPGVFADEMSARGVELDTWPIPERPEPPAEPHGYDAVLAFGGAMNVEDRATHGWIDRELELLAALLDQGTPLFGACLGTQLLAEAAGGSVRRASEPEIGWFEVEVLPAGTEDPVIGALPPSFEAFQWHSYEAVPPDGAAVLARSAVCPQAYRIGDRAWGIQFHAEVSSADAAKWISEWREDPDAVAIGLDPEALRNEMNAKIEAWNRLGRELCGRFCDAVA
jgi:GMP synthase-like glutamine amidotransferase